MHRCDLIHVHHSLQRIAGEKKVLTLQLEEHDKIFIVYYESVSLGCSTNCSKGKQETAAIGRDLSYRH